MFSNRRRRNDDRAGGLKVHLALGYTDMRKGTEGLAMLVQDTLKKDPFFGSFLRFPRWESPAYQHPFLGRERAVFVRQVARPRRIRVVADGGIRRQHYSFASATCDADRSRMSMPLLVRLTDSQVDLTGGVVSEVADGIHHERRISEQVGSGRLTID